MLIFNLLLLASTGVAAMVYLTASNSHGKFVRKKNPSENDSIYHRVNNGSSRTYKRGFDFSLNVVGNVKSIYRSFRNVVGNVKSIYRSFRNVCGRHKPFGKTTSPRKPFKKREGKSSQFTASDNFQS